MVPGADGNPDAIQDFGNVVGVNLAEREPALLKKTGSFYYHCDWHASHYVKVMLDQILGENNIQSEIIWHRTQAKGLAFTGFPNNHDTIFFYGGGDEITFNRPYSPYDPDNLDEKTDEKYSLRDPDGRGPI